VAAGCQLCARARATVEAVRREQPFDLEEVDIGGDAALEARYRTLLPVLEIDGRRAFTFHVPAAALRRALLAQSGSSSGSL
jgi:hypothetical protein